MDEFMHVGRKTQGISHLVCKHITATISLKRAVLCGIPVCDHYTITAPIIFEKKDNDLIFVGCSQYGVKKQGVSGITHLCSTIKEKIPSYISYKVPFHNILRGIIDTIHIEYMRYAYTRNMYMYLYLYYLGYDDRSIVIDNISDIEDVGDCKYIERRYDYRDQPIDSEGYINYDGVIYFLKLRKYTVPTKISEFPITSVYLLRERDNEKKIIVRNGKFQTQWNISIPLRRQKYFGNHDGHDQLLLRCLAEFLRSI